MKTNPVFILALALASAGSASAALVTFVPPNDPVGSVWTTNSNDGYSGGRGITFTVSAPTTLSSVGIYHDLTSINLSWRLTDFGGNDSNSAPFTTTFASGGGTVTTRGLEWIDFATSVNLTTGITYHLEFSHQGAGNQNFFYDNQNVPWSQDGFQFLEGTQGGGDGNYVVAAFRVNVGGPVGAPDAGSTAAMLLGAVLMLAGAARRLIG